VRSAAAAALGAALSLAGCASMDADYRAARESWQGATYEEVAAAWGPPTRTDRAGPQGRHTWSTEDIVPVRPGSGVYGGAGGVVFGAGSPNEAEVRCDRKLVFRGGRVADATWTGDPAFCTRFARRK
jgi:hypothetical protein